jgi:hypothetical protein
MGAVDSVLGMGIDAEGLVMGTSAEGLAIRKGAAGLGIGIGAEGLGIGIGALGLGMGVGAVGLGMGIGAVGMDVGIGAVAGGVAEFGSHRSSGEPLGVGVSCGMGDGLPAAAGLGTAPEAEWASEFIHPKQVVFQTCIYERGEDDYKRNKDRTA